MIKIATWNVNSIKPRLGHLLAWLQEARPDVVLLQETKSTDEAFPRGDIDDAGYHLAVHGQKTYNGVAVLSRDPIEVTCAGLPGDEADEQARYLEAVTSGIRVASVYAPNGNPVTSDKFAYKLAWLERFYHRAQALLSTEEPFVLGGDYNVAPEDGDVYDPVGWKDDALCRIESRRAWRKIVYLGLTDAYRVHGRELGRYTWWDYRGGGWSRDEGVRIDHLLLSPTAADRLTACDIDRGPRRLEKPSDHTPVWCELRG